LSQNQPPERTFAQPPAKPAAEPARKPVVIGAFEPFGGRKRNRSHDAASLLDGAAVAGHPVEVIRLPTVFAKLPRAVDELFARDPALVLLVGESNSARRLLVERLAVNVAHARLGDNAGARPIDDELVRGGELARRVVFDPRTAANAAVAAGVPCDVSSHAGTFCCNAVFYHALGHRLGRSPEGSSGALVAFVHVPAYWPWARDRRTARGLSAIALSLLNRP
jgi:pyroglutamyl-peptidase